jgi:hypothetical protein
MEWINYDDDTPEDNEVVLVCDCVRGTVTLAKFKITYRETEEEFETNFYIMYFGELEGDYCVTHWMRRPTAPKE